MYNPKLERSAMKLKLYVLLLFGAIFSAKVDTTEPTITYLPVISYKYLKLTLMYTATEQQPYIRTYIHM